MKKPTMKKKNIQMLQVIIISALSALLFACAPVSQTTGEAQQAVTPPTATAEPAEQTITDVAHQTPVVEEGQLPVRYQQPTYLLQDSTNTDLGVGDEEEIVIPVGADISSTTGPVALRDILKRLAALKDMNISWASDVDQFALVDVDIRAEDDFFKAIDNILRQMDYFHEVQGNSIVVKYRETRRFHVAMPFLKSTYDTGVGGDVLGAGGIGGEGSGGGLVGNIQLTSEANEFDIWGNIQTNLDQILQIWSETTPATTESSATGAQTTTSATTKRNVQDGKGYYTIDKPIGLITVTAPRRLVEKIESYIKNLKKQLYRQVSIEAKIIEVIVDDTEKKGIDWSSLVDTSLDLQMFGANGIIYAPNTAERVISQVSLGDNPFNILLSALETQGPTNILANPKISVMNGQPAVINIGENFRFIEKVETSVSDGVVSTSVTTNSVMSGLGLAVVATIMDNDEIILSMTPVTSSVSRIDDKSFGGLTVQLPTVKVREMNTMVKIKSGNMLMVGGLIDNVETDTVNKVPVLGDIHGLGRLFSHSTKTTDKKELVILLQPRII
jgi:general secretion pathway protein D/MSHA biogenesis protein MshL